MKIVKVWKDNYPWDVRVEKMCNTLINEGHDVHLLCRNTKNREIREEINGLHIHRLPVIRNKLINNICSLPTFFNPLWIYRLLKVVKNENIDVILVRDLPLVLSGIFVGKICRIPVVFDMAENYPALWKDHVSRKGIRIYNYFLKNPAVAEILENYVLKKVDHVIVVVEESKQRILKKGIPESKLSIVSNTPDLDIFDQQDKEGNQIEQDKFNLLYVGFVTVGRGLDTIIKSLQELSRKNENIYFVLVGDGKYLDELKIFDSKHGSEVYSEFLKKLEDDPDSGLEEAMKAIDAVRDDEELTQLLVMICRTVSEADGIVRPEEIDAIEHICGLLHIEPEGIKALEIDLHSEIDG